jgi:hypothetical protein
MLTSSASWSGRNAAAVAVFDTHMFLVGGLSGDGATTLSDVWTTIDGGLNVA